MKRNKKTWYGVKKTGMEWFRIGKYKWSHRSVYGMLHLSKKVVRNL